MKVLYLKEDLEGALKNLSPYFKCDCDMEWISKL